MRLRPPERLEGTPESGSITPPRFFKGGNGGEGTFS